MGDFRDVLNQLALDDKIGVDRFRQLAARLAGEGGIYSADSDIEREFYDDASRVETELEGYFWVMGCTLIHNKAFGYMRLCPPQATSPGAGLSGDEQVSMASMRRKISANVGAIALALRMLYSQKLASGEVLNDGEVETTVSEIRITLKTRLNRESAVTQGERRAIMRELDRGWRVIRIAPDVDSDDPDARVVIRPIIADILSEAVALGMEADAKSMGKSGGGNSNDDREENEGGEGKGEHESA